MLPGEELPPLASGMRRVNILTPCGDQLHSEFVASLVGMLQYTHIQHHDRLEAFAWQAYSTSILPFSRYTMALKSLAMGCSHMLWIDSDMSFPADMLFRFLDRDEELVGINAAARRPPYRSCAQTAPAEYMETTSASTGLEKAHRVGLGVMWMDCSVLAKIEPPWFDFRWRPDLVNEASPHGSFEGEDHYFCMRAKEAGFDIWVDQDLSKEVRHHGSFGFTPLMHEAASRGNQ